MRVNALYQMLDKDKFSLNETTVKDKMTRTWTCKSSGDTFVINEGDDSYGDLMNFKAKCESKSAASIKEVIRVGVSSLKQAPDNQWMVLEDTEKFGITKAPKSTIVSDPKKKLISRITQVKGQLVYLKDSKGLTPYIKLSDSKDKKFPYIPVKDSKDRLMVEPYYAWILKHEKEFEKENPSKLNLARKKMGVDDIAKIKSGNYTYAFDAAEAGQIDLETADNELLDNVRYSMSGDTRGLFVVAKPNTRVFIFDKEKGIVSLSNNVLKEGRKIRGVAQVEKEFSYKLPEMLNFDSNSFYPVNKLEKATDTQYQVKKGGLPLVITNGKSSVGRIPLVVGKKLSGTVLTPIISKTFSFVMLDDNKKFSMFVLRNNLNTMVSSMDAINDKYELSIGNEYRLTNSVEKANSSFEGGDIEDFHGGDVNFSGAMKREFLSLNGTEKFLGFDNNENIPDYEDNTTMYFNMDSNVLVLGSDYDNTKLDLSFDANDEEEVSNAIGDFFKDLFNKGKGELSEKLTESQAKKIADPNKVEYTPQEVQAMYKKSGSDKPLKDWLKSDASKDFLKNLSNIGYLLLLNKTQGGLAPTPNVKTDSEGNNIKESDDDNDNSNDSENTILGMHPITFGVVASVSVIGLGVVAWFIFRKK